MFVIGTIRRGLTPLRELDDVLRDCPLGRAGHLKLDLDSAQNFTGLRCDRIRPVRQDILVLQIGQCLPENILQATSREWPNNLLRGASGGAGDSVLAPLCRHVCGTAICLTCRFPI